MKLCQCGAPNTRAGRGRRAPRMIVCLNCWRRTPLALRKTFNRSRRQSSERLAAARAILEWLRNESAAKRAHAVREYELFRDGSGPS